MAKRAEEAALKAYPKDRKGVLYDLARKSIIQGYEQAEKDLALTPDDVWCIFNLVRDFQTKYSATRGCLQEVADIFNEQRKK